MGTMRRVLKALPLLCLAPLAGASCGDPALSAGAEAPPTLSVGTDDVYEYQDMKPVVLVDRGQWCATLKVGGVITFVNCFHADRLPILVYSSDARRLMLVAVESGDTIAFTDGSVRAACHHGALGRRPSQ